MHMKRRNTLTSASPSQKPEYINLSRIKSEFGLTPRQVRCLGEPDETGPNPYYRSGPPVRLYLRQRVEQWIAEHQNEIEASQLRRHSAQKAVHTKRDAAKIEIARLVQDLKLGPIASRARVREEAVAFFLLHYGDFSGEVTEKGLCSFIRHNYTNYEEILSMVKGKVGAADLYENVKVYLCCRIITYYGLQVSPLYAAFGAEDVLNQIPERFHLPEGEDLQAAVGGMLGIEDPG
jgi:hypothetical protein